MIQITQCFCDHVCLGRQKINTSGEALGPVQGRSLFLPMLGGFSWAHVSYSASGLLFADLLLDL